MKTKAKKTTAEKGKELVVIDILSNDHMMVKPVPVKTSLRREVFNRGFKDFMAGNPWPDDADAHRFYVYGRQFAAYMKAYGYANVRLKTGQKLNKWVEPRFKDFCMISFGFVPE